MSDAPDSEKILEEWRAAIGKEAFESAKPGQTLRACASYIPPPKSPPVDAAAPAFNSDAAVQITLVPSMESLARTEEFTIQELVAEDGAGQIFRADQGSLCRGVAIKKLLPEQLEKEAGFDAQDAFVAEALVTGVLEHPNIVPVHALGQDNKGHWFCSMKMVRGTSWKDLLHPESEPQPSPEPPTSASGPVALRDIEFFAQRASKLDENLKILHSVCNAVAFAHSKNLIHRDLKPENVMVGAFGEVLLVNWGLAVDVTDALDQAEARVPHKSAARPGGTAEYMAPEQTHADGNLLSTQTDVFLLGAILHELLTGRAPNAAENISLALTKAYQCDATREYDKGLPELAEICRKALSKQPQKRYANASEFQAALNEYSKHHLSTQTATKAAREAKRNDSRSLARAVVLYDQALELWPGNKTAANAAQKARAALAEMEFASSRARFMAKAIAAALIVGLSVAFFWMRSERQDAFALKLEAEKQKADADNQKQEANVQRSLAQDALWEQKLQSFEAVYRNAEADDAAGDSAKVVDELKRFVSAAELAGHEAMPKAKDLVAKAEESVKRFAAFFEKVKAGEKSVTLDLGNRVTLDLVLVPAGSFEMGSARHVRETPHTVDITQPFYMGKFPVTQEQFETVTGTNPSVSKVKHKYPVDSVNWFEAVAFCNKLNKLAAPAKAAFALPTEAQWEYACRAGTKTEYYFGNNEKDLEKYAWFEANADDNGGSQQVGTKPANPWGLYDMHGNVYQWCQDWYELNYYRRSPKEDPTGPKIFELLYSANSESRVLRGGSYADPALNCRSARRTGSPPDSRFTCDRRISRGAGAGALNFAAFSILGSVPNQPQ